MSPTKRQYPARQSARQSAAFPRTRCSCAIRWDAAVPDTGAARAVLAEFYELAG